MAKRDEQAMAGLTEDELAAIKEADAEEAGAVEETDDAEDKPEARDRDEKGRFKAKEDSEADSDAEKDDAITAKDAENEAEEGGKTEDKSEEGEDGDDETPLRPAPQAKGPEDVDAKLADIAKQRDELADKFDNGDITAKEFTRATADLNKQERDIERSQDRATMAQEMRTDTWLNQTVPAFLEEHAAYRDNPTLHTMLDAEVRKLQVKAMQDGNDPFDPNILAYAHKAIVGAIGSLTGEKPKKDEPKAEPKKDAPKKRPSAPPTLAHVPSADATETDSEFAVLDRLADSDPEKFEDAMARMKPADRERYLAN